MFDCPYGNWLLTPLCSWGVRPASPFTEGMSRGGPRCPGPLVPHQPLSVLGPFQGFWSLHFLLLPTGLGLKLPTPLCVSGATALSSPSLAGQNMYAGGSGLPLALCTLLSTQQPERGHTHGPHWPLCSFPHSLLSFSCFILSLVPSCIAHLASKGKALLLPFPLQSPLGHPSLCLWIPKAPGHGLLPLFLCFC